MKSISNFPSENFQDRIKRKNYSIKLWKWKSNIIRVHVLAEFVYFFLSPRKKAKKAISLLFLLFVYTYWALIVLNGFDIINNNYDDKDVYYDESFHVRLETKKRTGSLKLYLKNIIIVWDLRRSRQ